MTVEQGSVVTLTYDLTTESGEIVESSDISGAITVLVGAGSIIPGLDRHLVGLEVGAERTFEFPPEEAFGRVEDAPTKVLSTSELPAGIDLEPGQRFEAGLPGGQKILLEFVEAVEGGAKMRMLHPLAGQKIGMTIKVEAVRAPTATERETGRVQTAPPPPPRK